MTHLLDTIFECSAIFALISAGIMCLTYAYNNCTRTILAKSETQP